MTGQRVRHWLAARANRPRIEVALIWMGLLLMTVALILAIPRGAGPDEQQHVARGAALVRGQIDGESDWPLTSYVWFDVPWWVLSPNPGCYAFQPLQPASCATLSPPDEDGDVRVLSQSASYPPTAHLLAGAATLLPGEARTQWIARLFDAFIPVGLVGWALSRLARTGPGRLPLLGGLVALTPGVMFFMAVVNPSGWSAAGAFAMWVALLAPGRPQSSNAGLWVAGWCALVLGRFDGLAFALLIGLIASAWGADSLFDGIARRRNLWSMLVGSALVNILWTAHYGRRQWLAGGRSLQFFVAAVLLIGVLAAARRSAGRTMIAAIGRRLRMPLWVLPLVLVPVPIAAFIVLSIRHDRPYAAAVGSTGNSLHEMIGLLGWIDTAIPESAFALWFVAFGALVGVALLGGVRREVVVLVTLIANLVVMQWFLQQELDYWHGRYLFPLAVGIPILASSIAATSELISGARTSTSFTVVIGSLVGLVWVLGFAQMIRRFAVNEVGIMNPLRWNTYSTVVHPVYLIIGFTIGSLCLLSPLVVGGKTDPTPTETPELASGR